MSKFILWSFKKRLYNGDVVLGSKRKASFKKIEAVSDKLIKGLNLQGADWKRIAGWIRLFGEREFESEFFRLSIVREVFEKPYPEICEKPLDRIKIAFEWTAREKDGFGPSFCFEVTKPRNWKNPNIVLISAEGRPIQLTRFTEIIIRDFQDLKRISFSQK